MQSSTPAAPPENAALLSRISASIPADAARAGSHFLFSNLPHLERIYARGPRLIHMLFLRGERMKPKQKFKDYLSEKTVNPELFPVIPIVELAGSRRVLIENHLGVTQYSKETIGIKMKYGEIQINGCGLTLEQMTRVKLVVTGRIDGICLHRREKG